MNYPNCAVSCPNSPTSVYPNKRQMRREYQFHGSPYQYVCGTKGSYTPLMRLAPTTENVLEA